MWKLLLLGLITWTAPLPAANSGGICLAQNLKGPTLCPTEDARQVSVPRRLNLPLLDVEPVEYESWASEELLNTPDVYAWIDDFTPIYRHPAEAQAGLPPVRVSETGFTYLSLVGETTYEGEHWYQLNVKSPRNSERADEWVHEVYVHLVRPSTFAGVHLAAQPDVPFAWVLRNVRPSVLPGADPDPDLPLLYRYDRVNIYGVERVDNYNWYLISANQWVKQTYVGIVDVSPRPAEVAPDEKWIEVDLYEQTLAAYEGDRMIFATLVSSGLPQWETRTGLFRIWEKVLVGKMSGRENKPDYYYLEDVPWTMYFDFDIGLHAAYWHDGFGYRHSHGCVNLPPAAAQWLYLWTDPYVPEGILRYDAAGTWVWVH